MFDEAVTSILDAVALLAVAAGAAVLIVGSVRLGVGLVVAGAVLLSSTVALGYLSVRAARGHDGGEGA